ncbi:hypothetical protein OAJ46_01225 [Candidatus Pelagibacter sp.]|nr:hypothetical protein [Candidatus Pelagibacter sp.]
MKLKVAIIVDKLKIKKWQLDSLDAIKDEIEIKSILNCTNTIHKKKFFQNFLYYILNFFNLRNYMTRNYPVPNYGINIVNFKSSYSKNWQTIPTDVIKDLKKQKIKLIIKFGMNLLNIDDELDKIDIFSFHHGDPSQYKGRPAGFYEIFHDKKKTGVIVQKLSNRLDSGDIYAFGEVKNINYSYRKTAINFYSLSPFLLLKSINNLKNGIKLNIGNSGKTFSLPSNYIVILFVKKIILNLVKKIFYGLFYEKKWKVAFMNNNILLEEENFILKSSIQEIPIKKKYNFYADPFFSTDGKKVRLEALNYKTGLGEILEVDVSNLKEQKVILSGKHYSYPYSCNYNDKELLLPEVASHSEPFLLSLKNPKNFTTYIKGFQNSKIVDATLFKKDDYWYLFFGFSNNSENLLNLYISKNLDETFNPHPNSPICLSPTMSRMAGKIINVNSSIYRFGQNNEGEYGRGIFIQKIKEISPLSYSEISCGSIFIEQYQGPHCLNFSPDKSRIILDYYEDGFSLLAGYRRIIAKIRN